MNGSLAQGFRSLHVCYISQEYPPETGWGGVGAYTFEMAHALAAAGHRVTVISRALDRESISSADGVEVHRIVPRPTWDNIPFFWRLNKVWPGFAWAAMVRTRAVHRRQPIDIVETAEVRGDGFFVALWPGRPRVVARLHTPQIFVDSLNSIPKQRIHSWNYWLEKKTIKRASVVTSPSRAMVDLTRTWMGLKRREPVVIPNPVNETSFYPLPTRGKNVVLFTGRLERRKGIHIVAAAIPKVLEKLPATEFLFLGSDGVDVDGVKWSRKLIGAVAGHQQKQIRFDQKSREGLLDAYQQAAICILPSLWENFPYALLEAMACGTPVIATECGGFPELIESGVSGFLVPVNDPDALANCILRLLNDPALATSTGANARRRVETFFTPRQVLPEMIAAYELGRA